MQAVQRRFTKGEDGVDYTDLKAKIAQLRGIVEAIRWVHEAYVKEDTLYAMFDTAEQCVAELDEMYNNLCESHELVKKPMR
jgi:hypothetical protein